MYNNIHIIYIHYDKRYDSLENLDKHCKRCILGLRDIEENLPKIYLKRIKSIYRNLKILIALPINLVIHHVVTVLLFLSVIFLVLS